MVVFRSVTDEMGCLDYSTREQFANSDAASFQKFVFLTFFQTSIINQSSINSSVPWFIHTILPWDRWLANPEDQTDGDERKFLAVKTSTNLWVGIPGLPIKAYVQKYLFNECWKKKHMERFITIIIETG